MTTTLDLSAAWVPILLEPGDAVSIPVTIPAGYDTGTWTASVYTSRRQAGSPTAFTVTGPTSLVLTLALSSAQVAALAPAGTSRFTGYWELVRTVASASRTWLKGDFVIDADHRQAANGAQAVTVSINSGAITVTGTAAAGGGGGSMTGAAILAALAPVDGPSSGLDADTVDGIQAAALALDSAVVHLTGNETVAGTKTFTSPPAVPDGSWAIAKTTGLQTALDGKQPVDADLTTIAGLTATTDNVIQSVAGAWASRTPAQAKTALGFMGRYAATVGDGSSTTLTVTHSLGSTDVETQVRDAATNTKVDCNVVNVDANTVTLGPFFAAPASNSLKVVVIG
jgi:hypothetical protein